MRSRFAASPTSLAASGPGERCGCSGPAQGKVGLIATLATGAALLGVGLPLDKSGFVVAGVPTALVGAAVLALGFVFDGQVDVNYPGIDAFF